MGRDRSFWALATKLDTSLSIAEKFWQVSTVLFVGGGGLFTSWLAKADPILKDLGPVYWVVTGVLTSVLIACALNLVRAATLKKEMANYYASLSLKKSTVNPLLDSFHDLIIAVEDLRIPGIQEHRNKTFKRCKFVGPATLSIGGGNLSGVRFHGQGDVVALENGTFLTGVVFLNDCVIQDCEFFNITVLADQTTARALHEIGFPVSGLKLG